ncbi:MAG: hypothetical protein ACJAVR_000169 [Paracoccaceae bacterium]|jgi:hypothetical protein
MLDTTTFFSPWYWALAMSVWVAIGAGTYGVPHGLMRRAARMGADDAAMADRIARDFAARAAAFWPRWGLASIAGTSFVLTALMVLALVAGSEAALGLLMIAGPAAALAGLSMHEALLVHTHQPRAEVLLEVMISRRRMNLSVGGGALALTALIAVLMHQDRLMFFAPI